ncbi:MAG TPA: cyclic nucleotide-binding domain-containing protein [Chthonomonadaceae bacterium]|nr:cyclic nucleotide-binding domain-containing protein [Chthonomonadaceae bacterium]
MENLERILSDHPFFAALGERYLPVLVGCAMNVRFDDGEMIFREGGEADQFYLIRDGKVALDVAAPGREPITVHTLTAGEVLGWSWLVPPYRWHFDARVVEPVRAFALDGACLRAKCELDHDLGYALMKQVAQITTQRLQATRRQMLDIHEAWSHLVAGRS